MRRCPLCRATSFYVIPSNEPIFDPEVKQQIVEAYKKNMSSNMQQLLPHHKRFHASTLMEGKAFVLLENPVSTLIC